MNRQRRAISGGAVRAYEDENGDRFIDLMCVRYNVLDDFKTVWLPGVFTEGLSQRQPTLAWAHSWSDMIGRGVGAEDTSEGLIVPFRLDYHEDVPRARQAYTQVLSGTVDDCSVGFSNLVSRPPTEAERQLYPGVKEMMVSADLDEVSLVLRGAVPGAKVLALRSAQLIDAEVAGQIMARYGASEIDLIEALQLVKAAAIPDPDDKPKEKTPEEIEAEEKAAAEAKEAQEAVDAEATAKADAEQAELDAIETEIAEALEVVNGAPVAEAVE